MTNEEMKLEFEKNVEYLRRNVPPDDIYLFTEQTFMAALYFLKRWSLHEDVNEVCKENFIARKWVVNIMGLLRCRDQGIEIQLDLNLDSLESENANSD